MSWFLRPICFRFALRLVVGYLVLLLVGLSFGRARSSIALVLGGGLYAVLGLGADQIRLNPAPDP